MRPLPKIIHTTARDGAPVAKIALTNRPGRFVTMDLEDWTEWLAEGRTVRLYATGNGTGREYPAFADPSYRGGNATVARALLGLGKGRVVRFADGDTTNLRRNNLATVAGKTGGRKRLPEHAKVPPAEVAA